MSAEIMPEYNNEKVISTATEKMERTMRQVGSIANYIEEIQNRCARQPYGRVEISQMIRAAQFLTYNKAGVFDEKVQSVYHGELLGLELVNSLEPDSETTFKSGFAQAFIKYNLDKSLPKGPYAEIDKHQQRLFQRSIEMQISLSPRSDSYKLNRLYEMFGQKITARLTDDAALMHFAMMGFRMIVTEAVNPSSDKTTIELLEFVEEITDGRVPVVAEETHVDEAAFNDDVEEPIVSSISVESLNEIVSDPGKNEWENFTYARDNLINKYYKIMEDYQDFGSDDPQDSVRLAQRIEDELSSFNHSFELIKADDILVICGELFGSTSDNGKSEPIVVRYSENTEIRGQFVGIKMIKVPSKSEIMPLILDPDEESFVFSPVIRLKDPMWIDYGQAEVLNKQFGFELFIDIPLTYDDVEYQRMILKTLENEA